jgi:TonB-linked SusC/RagA family outer membrane protein
MKKCSLILAMMLCCCIAVFAQRTITGTVVDSQGEVLIGASVFVRGTSSGTVTDIDGKYSLVVPEAGNTLIISFTGFETQEMALTASNLYDIILAEGLELSEVVVTGLGIKKEKKALGYGVATIGNESLEGRQEADIARLLRGKATGVDITQTSGLAGSGTNIIIRGYSTITGSNQPLFIVDGIPFNTSTNSPGQSFASGSATASSRFLDLDPNSIEEISILKGLSATVLYGEAGKNGVILVTTKNGSAGANANKKMEISVSQGVYRSEVANLPEYQNNYGNGFNGGFGWFFSNWGAAFSDLKPSSYGSDYKGEKDGNVLVTHPYDQAQFRPDFPELAGAEYAHKAYTGIEDFFTPGWSSNTSVSLQSQLGQNASVSATYSYLSDGGFTPKLDEQRGGGRSNYIDKHNFGLGAQTKLANGIKLKGSFNFVNTDRLSPLTGPAFGGDGNGLFAALLFTPRSIDLMNLPYQSPIDGRNVYYRRGGQIQNPRWVLNNTGQSENIQRFFSSTEVSYDFTKNFKAFYRLSYDEYSQTNRRYLNKGGVGQPLGELSTFNVTNRLIDQLVNVVYEFKLSENFTLDGILGANARREVKGIVGTSSSNQFVFDLFTHNNFIDHNAFSGESEENTLGLYATTSLAFKNFLYLNLQARNDWTSTLEKENQSVFYPSASVSFVPTDAFGSLAGNKFLNYLKLRLGYGTSAGYPEPYSTRSVLSSATNVFSTAGGRVLNINEVSNRLGNRNLKNELITELEGGVEARILGDRITIDMSLYNKVSNDLIINLPLDPATGYTLTTVNGAEVQNKGIELGLTISPFKGDFQWNITLNYTKNISEVTSIIEGVEQVQIASPNGIGETSFAGYTTLGNYAIPGEPYGVIYGGSFLKNEEGKYIVNGVGEHQSSGKFEVIGDPNPNFTANWINNFSFKGLSFGFQWQYINGGDIYSSTVQALMARGNTSDTDFDRSIPIVVPNAVKADGTPNDIQTYAGDSFFTAYFTDEGGIFDATVIRLREVSFAYALPKRLLDKTPFGRLGISISGENLFYNAPNFPKGINFDPEVLSLGVGNGRGFDFRTAPTAKKYGVTLNATF